MGTNYGDKGQKDAAKDSSRNTWADTIADTIFGGTYNPPSNKDDKDAYQKGWNNTKEQNRKK